tara:strand:+ start:656 stop:826 length:171 start_codon:yes stop_codon:yes gene_type:complete
MVVYAIEMRKKYGKNIIEKLYKRSQRPKNWTVKELEKLIVKYGTIKAFNRVVKNTI